MSIQTQLAFGIAGITLLAMAAFFLVQFARRAGETDAARRTSPAQFLDDGIHAEDLARLIAAHTHQRASDCLKYAWPVAYLLRHARTEVLLLRRKNSNLKAEALADHVEIERLNKLIITLNQTIDALTSKPGAGVVVIDSINAAKQPLDLAPLAKQGAAACA